MPGNSGKVHMFVDVSGSQDEVFPYVLRLMRDAGRLIDPDVNVFSTVIDTLSINDIRLDKLEFENTGGTDFDCVLNHAIKKGYGSIVVLTDGYSDVSEPVMKRAKKAKIRVLVGFTETSGYKINPFGKLTIDEFKLPRINNEAKSRGD